MPGSCSPFHQGPGIKCEKMNLSNARAKPRTDLQTREEKKRCWFKATGILEGVCYTASLAKSQLRHLCNLLYTDV